MATRLRARHHSTIVAMVVVFALVAAACGSDSKKGGGGKNATTPTTAGKPQSGGSVTFALPAETSGGWCLQEGQLAISGIQVARAIYDTLVVPDVKEGYKPFLAESVTGNADSTVWTIKIRPGIKFHDGTDLDAEVVRNNIDAYRGKYPNRSPLLFIFVFGNYIKSTRVVDPMTVEVTTVPWSAFPAYLYASGRAGIMAQAQLDDKTTCASKLIGTGPFKIQDWKRNDHFTAVKNPDYWRTDKDGVKLPYLDKIIFKPVIESAQVVNGIQAGNLDLALDDGALDIVEFRKFAESGTINLTESEKFPELSYTLFNTTVEPFNNKNARLAVAYAVDRETQNRLRNKGISTLASGPFGPGVMGYLKDTGFPSYDEAKAKDYVSKYTDETGKPLEFTYLSAGTDPEGLKTINLIKTYVSKVGIKMTVKAVDESQGINNVIAKQYQAVGWRNHPGFDPDTEWVWWHCSATPADTCDNPVNFGGFNDPIINKAFEVARVSKDQAERKTQYETINKRFASEVYNGWGFYTDWSIPAAKKVHGIGNLPLPDGSAPFPGFTSGIDPAGIWVSQ